LLVPTEKELRRNLEKIKSFQAEFEERVFSFQGERILRGRIYFKRPCLLRIEIDFPEKEKIVSNCRKAYIEMEGEEPFYYEEENLANLLPALFFVSKEVVKIKELKGIEGGVEVRLVPSSRQYIKEVTVHLDSSNFAPKEMEVTDPKGVRYLFFFKKRLINPPLEDTLFAPLAPLVKQE